MLDEEESSPPATIAYVNKTNSRIIIIIINGRNSYSNSGNGFVTIWFVSSPPRLQQIFLCDMLDEESGFVFIIGLVLSFDTTGWVGTVGGVKLFVVTNTIILSD